ncbi:MAG TPA: dihydrofolate reductase family protein [Acidimicrobiales bacterium]
MLWPTPADDVDVAALYAAADRRPVGPRPHVLVTMISTVDGSATDDSGVSGGLGGAADRAAFRAIRAVADVVVAGAGTVRGEGYGPPRTPPELQEARVARGQAPHPRIAVVSASLRLDPALPLFGDPDGPRPLVVTTATADRDAHRRLERVADVVVAGESAVDWPRALAELRTATGAAVAVVEGGPTVNGQLVTADLVDELCLTLAPALAGGDGPRIAHGPPAGAPRSLAPAHVLEADGFLLLRYVALRPSPAA